MSVVKLIDAHGRFNLEAIRQLLSGLNSTTLKYVVSILGSEGKGKSTILNALFATRFIEAAADRDEISRTTNGVDAAVSNDILALDVEGFDSSGRQARPREEVKEERNIENKFALFALLASDVIIINLKVDDCGCYNASGMRLLETIFKATQQLNKEQQLRTKKKILFFVRDVGRQTPDSIMTSINNRLHEVYARIGQQERAIHRLLEIEVVLFPHYEYCREAFDAKVHQVRTGLSHQSHSSQFRGVPSSRVAEAFNSIWKALQQHSGVSTLKAALLGAIIALPLAGPLAIAAGATALAEVAFLGVWSMGVGAWFGIGIDELK